MIPTKPCTYISMRPKTMVSVMWLSIRHTFFSSFSGTHCHLQIFPNPTLSKLAPHSFPQYNHCIWFQTLIQKKNPIYISFLHSFMRKKWKKLSGLQCQNNAVKNIRKQKANKTYTTNLISFIRTTQKYLLTAVPNTHRKSHTSPLFHVSTPCPAKKFNKTFPSPTFQTLTENLTAMNRVI